MYYRKKIITLEVIVVLVATVLLLLLGPYTQISTTLLLFMYPCLLGINYYKKVPQTPSVLSAVSVWSQTVDNQLKCILNSAWYNTSVCLHFFHFRSDDWSKRWQVLFSLLKITFCFIYAEATEKPLKCLISAILCKLYAYPRIECNL